MTTTAPLSIVRVDHPGDRPAESRMRLVPVPTGRVSLVDRVLMQLGLALLLASTRHAERSEQRSVRIELDRRPTGAARPFC